MAVVVLLITGSQVQSVLAALPVFGAVTSVFVVRLVMSVAFGLWMGVGLRLGEPAIRALAL